MPQYYAGVCGCTKDSALMGEQHSLRYVASIKILGRRQSVGCGSLFLLFLN